MMDQRQVEMKLKDNDLYHFCVFSDKILATSVVINLIVINFKNPENIVITQEIFIGFY